MKQEEAPHPRSVSSSPTKKEEAGSSPVASTPPRVDLARTRIVDGTRNKKTDESLARDVIRGGGVLVKGERIEFWFDPSQPLGKQGLEESQSSLSFGSVEEGEEPAPLASAPIVASSTSKKAAAKKKVSLSGCSRAAEGQWVRGTISSSNKSRWTVMVDLDAALPIKNAKKGSVVVHAKTARWKLVEIVHCAYSGKVFQPRADQRPNSGGSSAEMLSEEQFGCELVFSDFACKSIDLAETKKEFFKLRKADPLIKKTYSFKYSVPAKEQAEMDELRKTEREGLQTLNRDVRMKTEEITWRMQQQLDELAARRAAEVTPLESALENLKRAIDFERDEKTANLEALEGRASGTGSSLRVQKKQIDDLHRSRITREVVPLEKRIGEIEHGFEKSRRIVEGGANNEIATISLKRDEYMSAVRERQQTLRDKWKKLSEDDVNGMRLSLNIRLEKEWVQVRGKLQAMTRFYDPAIVKGLDLVCSQCKLEQGFAFQRNRCDECFKFDIFEQKINELDLKVPWSNNRSSSELLPYHVFYQERSKQVRADRGNVEPALVSQQVKEEWKRLSEKQRHIFEKKRQVLLLELLDHVVEDPADAHAADTLKRPLILVENKAESESESDSDEACMKCLSLKRPGLILQCDRTEGEALNADDDRICGGMLHTYCCSPRLDSVPAGTWFCSSTCKWVQEHKPVTGCVKKEKKRAVDAQMKEVAFVDEDEERSTVKLDVAVAKKHRFEFILSQWSLIEYFLGGEGQAAEKIKKSIETKLAQLAEDYSDFSSSIQLGPKLASAGVPFPFDHTPDYVQASMREYQLEGLSWFVRQHDLGANSIMGDEMGLGKTLQTLSFLATLHKFIPFFSPALVVAPLSVLPNWLAEAKKWTPQLNVVGLFGPLGERERIKSNLLHAAGVHVIVTTYEILLTEITWLRSQYYFRYFILDEAQKIKNTDALVTQACRQIRSVFRVLLTGTPLQNNMKELWALLNFLYPEVFTASSSGRFSSAYDSSTAGEDTSGSMIKDDTLMKQCFKLLEPIMLRRLKQNVLAAHLPPKTEIVLQAPMSLAQKHHYRQVLKTVTGLVRNVGYKNVSSLLWQLWKCCLHPFLFDSVVKEEESNPHHEVDSKIVWMSGKMCLLDALLLKLFDAKSKCLVYSQYTSMLDIIEEYCQWRGWRYLRLDGSTSLARRRFYMHLFNKPVVVNPPNDITEDFAKNHYFVFLVSTKAGGVGVNLQAANSVVLYDSSWNPFVDAQAEDRAHRMGQKKEVTIYRLITKDSCEERIRFFAQQKLKMKQFVLNEDENGEKAVLEADLADDESADVGKIYSKDQLQDIIEYGSVGEDDLDNEAQFNAVLGEQFYNACCASLDDQLEQARSLKADVAKKILTSQNKLSPVKKNICIRKFQDEDFTQTRVERTTEMDWLDKMEEDKVMQRNRKATTVTVDTKERGLGKIQISKWSIDQEAREKEMMERDRARIEAKKIGGNKRVNEHDMNCLHCRDSVLKQRVIVSLETDEKGNQVKKRRIDSDNSGFQACPICPATIHLSCLRLAVHGADLSTRTSCPQHKCRICRRSASNAGGLIFRCVDCPIALCYDCIEKYELVDKFQYIEREKVRWETELHFVAASTYEYMHCPECLGAAAV